jgi:hypothetical protein
MINWFSKFLDYSSEYLAKRKGLLPLAGIALILLNLLLVSFLPANWFITPFIVKTNLFLHLGLIVALFGLMLSWAL